VEEKDKTALFLVSEDKALAENISALVSGQGYALKTYAYASQAIADAEKDPPQLVISDTGSPNAISFDLCKDLRKNFGFRYIPPIILAVSGTLSENREKIIYSGCDDYIQKEEIGAELLLKIKLTLCRAARNQDIHPLTRLPGQSSLLAELSRRIQAKDRFAVYYADLCSIRAINQRYGFQKGDEIIKYTASLILKAVKDFGSPSDFVAHTQNDDFVFISLPDSVDTIAAWLTEEFDKNVASFYETEDVKRGYILLKNRKGEIQQAPFLSLYLGILTNEHFTFNNPGQVIQVAMELKDFARNTFKKSSYVKDRRKNYAFK
jgi:GGDEF domain-containing protein